MGRQHSDGRYVKGQSIKSFFCLGLHRHSPGSCACGLGSWRTAKHGGSQDTYTSMNLIVPGIFLAVSLYKWDQCWGVLFGT